MQIADMSLRVIKPYCDCGKELYHSKKEWVWRCLTCGKYFELKPRRMTKKEIDKIYRTKERVGGTNE